MLNKIQLVILTSVLAGACGGSGFSTGVPPNKPLGSVTPAEAQQICAATASFLESKGTATSCRFEAVGAALAQGKTTAEARMICNQKESDCLKASSGSGSGSGSGTNSCQPPPAACMATVGEYEACLNDTAAAYDKVINTVPTCDALTVPPNFTPPSTDTIQPPASCKTLTSKCPTVRIGTGASSGADPTKK